MSHEDPVDVLVIGAGPAGCATGTVLADHGHNVLLLEKETFPRYRVGESLIPFCWHPLQRLGLVEALDRARFTVKKYSVQFVGRDGRLSTPFYFSEHLQQHDASRTWQVVRSQFDQLLLENAQQHGARIQQGTTVRELLREGPRVVGVRALTPAGEFLEYRAPVTVDCSGREMLSQVRNDWSIPDPRLKKIAVWTYYRGAARDPGIDEGATTVAYLPDKGWFWYIPLTGDVVSVGIVADHDYLYRSTRDPEEIFQREVGLQPWIEQHLRPGQKIEKCRVTGDYSYRSRYSAVDGLLLTGDAFAFLDPVFSSGVFLALYGGVLAGDAVHAALEAGDVSAARFADYSERYCRAIEAMRRLVYVFYDHSFDFAEFLRDHPDLRSDLTDCLIGNVEKDLDTLFRTLADYADIPEPLTHGRPRE